MARERELLEQLRTSGLADVIEAAIGTRLPTLETDEDRVTGGIEHNLAPAKYAPTNGYQGGWMVEIPKFTPEDEDGPLILALKMRFPNAGAPMGMYKAQINFNGRALFLIGKMARLLTFLPEDPAQRASQVDEALCEMLTNPRFSYRNERRSR